ncbi:hypothetical protein [Pseudochelatococcus sp. G4_1912]|uniref:hypothetical protein n=1 Tax=Pseudochelatococcus sp. G4_1912 TaxID=3114288 RepID=UPI0039C6031C
MADYHFGKNLLILYAQLTPWVQALLGLGLCLVVISVTYLLKEIVVALMQPFQNLQASQQALQLEILQKLDRLLTRSILNFHLGIR